MKIHTVEQAIDVLRTLATWNNGGLPAAVRNMHRDAVINFMRDQAEEVEDIKHGAQHMLLQAAETLGISRRKQGVKLRRPPKSNTKSTAYPQVM